MSFVLIDEAKVGGYNAYLCQMNHFAAKKRGCDSTHPRSSCGGRIRTCDLQVMSLASYQLLHSAIFLKRVQRYDFFSRYPNNCAFFL